MTATAAPNIAHNRQHGLTIVMPFRQHMLALFCGILAAALISTPSSLDQSQRTVLATLVLSIGGWAFTKYPIMDQYVGLDVSLEDTSVCIVNVDGKVIREIKVLTDPDALAKELVALKLDFKRLGLEASSLGGWLHAELSRRCRGSPPHACFAQCPTQQDRP
jgi:hypothetical protein